MRSATENLLRHLWWLS